MSWAHFGLVSLFSAAWISTISLNTVVLLVVQPGIVWRVVYFLWNLHPLRPNWKEHCEKRSTNLSHDHHVCFDWCRYRGAVGKTALHELSSSPRASQNSSFNLKRRRQSRVVRGTGAKPGTDTASGQQKRSCPRGASSAQLCVRISMCTWQLDINATEWQERRFHQSRLHDYEHGVVAQTGARPGCEVLGAFTAHSFKVVSKGRHQHLYKSGKPPLENRPSSMCTITVWSGSRPSLLQVFQYPLWRCRRPWKKWPVACKEACAPGSNAPRSPELWNPCPWTPASAPTGTSSSLPWSLSSWTTCWSWFFWTMCPDCLVYMSNLKLCLRFFR